MKIGEFFISLFVDAGQGELTINNLVSSMGELEVASVGEVAILFELANKLAMMTDMSIKAAMGFHDYSVATGASTDALQKWQAAAAHVNISGEAVASTMEKISSNLAGIKFGHPGQLANLIQPLRMSLMGLDAEHPERLLERIRTSPEFQRMSQASQKYVLDQAGLGSLLAVLTRHHGGVSDADFKRFVREAGAMPSSDIDKFVRIKSEFTSIWELTKRIQQVIASWTTGPLLDWLTTIRSGMTKVAEAIDDRKHPKQLATDIRGAAAVAFHPLSMPQNLFNSSEFLGFLLAKKLEHMINPSVNRPFAPHALNPFASGETKKTVNVQQTVNLRVGALKMDPKEFEASLSSVMGKTNTELAAQINTGPH